MCNRFSINTSLNDLWTTLSLPPKDSSNFQVCHNIMPGEQVPIIHCMEEKVRISLMEWGLIPRLHSLENKIKFVNAEVEHIDNNPFFRHLIDQRRCLVPMSGFYEWDCKTVPHQPYYFYLPYRELFTIAGLWDIARVENEDVYTFTILTREASPSVRSVHSRMPVVVTPANHQRWLEDPTFDVASLLPAPPLYFYRIGNKVNDSCANEMNLLNPVPS